MFERRHTKRRHEDSDEVSLRDLYLIFKRGLVLILTVAVLAGILAFAVTSLLPPVYEAESTTLVTPPQVQIEDTGNLSFNPFVDVSFESYQTLALSHPVLEDTLAAVPEAELGPGALRGMGSLERLLGPTGSSQTAPLSVTHRVRAGDPELAAALADAWARSTLQTVRRSLLDNLDPVNAATSSEVGRLEQRLQAAEEAWAAFLARDTRGLLRTRLDQLQRLISDAEQGLVAQDEIRYLQAGPGSEDAASAVPVRMAAEPGGLSFSTRIDLDQEIVAAEAALSSLRSSGGAAEVAALEARLAALQARRNLLAEELDGYRSAYGELLAELSALELERSRLARELERAQADFEEVTRLDTAISYLTELAPSDARVLSNASIPAAPVGPRPLLNTALAVLVGGLLALLFVFLREAVTVRGGRPQAGGVAYSSKPSASEG